MIPLLLDIDETLAGRAAAEAFSAGRKVTIALTKEQLEKAAADGIEAAAWAEDAEAYKAEARAVGFNAVKTQLETLSGELAGARAELHQARRARDEAERRAEHFESLANEGRELVAGMLRDRQRTEKILSAVGGRGGVPAEVFAEFRKGQDQLAEVMGALVDRLGQPQPAALVRATLEVPEGGLPIALPTIVETLDVERDANGLLTGGRKILRPQEPA